MSYLLKCLNNNKFCLVIEWKSEGEKVLIIKLRNKKVTRNCFKLLNFTGYFINSLFNKESKVYQANGYVCSIVEIDDYLLFGGYDIYVIKNETTYKVLNGHNDYVRSIIKLPDTIFASGSEDKSIIIWEYLNFSIIKRIEHSHSNYVNSLLLHNNNLISCSWDQSIKVWELTDYKMAIQKEKAHNHYINQVISNEEFIISCSWDTYIKGWLLINKNITMKWQLQDDNQVNSICLLTKDILVSGGDNKMLILWDLANQSKIKAITTGHTEYIRRIALLSDDLVITGSDDSTVKIIDLESMSCIKTFEQDYEIGLVSKLKNNKIGFGGYDNLTIMIY